VQYTFPYELEPNGIAGVKFKPVENGSACQFMASGRLRCLLRSPHRLPLLSGGAAVHAPLGRVHRRNAYALVKEPHCHGHNEPRQLSIEIPQEQGVVEYDELGRGWRQLVLKKSPPARLSAPRPKRSLQLWFMACYDLDRFRDFVASTAFNEGL